MRRRITLGCALTIALILPTFSALARQQQQAKTTSQRRTNLAARSSGAASATVIRSMAAQITAEQLKSYLYFIASDELEGRDTPSRGLNIAAKFIAANLSRWNLKPAGDNGTFFQKIDLRRTHLDAAQTRVEISDRSFKLGDDFLAQTVAGAARGPLVYVGDGWIVKAKNINAYENIDVRDKVVIVNGTNQPRGVGSDDLQGEKGVDWDTPLSYAVKHGARALIVIPDNQELMNWDRVRRNTIERGVTIVNDSRALTSSAIPVITASTEMVNALFSGEKLSGADVMTRARSGETTQSFALEPNKQINISVQITADETETQNVVAAIEGSDPTLKNEYLAIGAHYDHVGIGTPVNGDAIYNGADDDGSGTVALLALAETFAHNKHPKRSILFVWHAGEEKGLWGSRFFTQHPTVPITQIIAQLNIDMIGRSKKVGDTNPRNKNLTGPDEIYVIGSRMMSTALGDINDRVNKSYLNLTFNYKYDAPNDTERLFFRSDHYNYAQRGIPIIFYFDGVHEDYHRPGDSPDKIDYTKYEKVARTIFATAWTLANTPQRPIVDKQLPGELRRTN